MNIFQVLLFHAVFYPILVYASGEADFCFELTA